MGAGEVRLFRFASVPMKLVRAECGPDVVLRQGKQSVASSLVEATLRPVRLFTLDPSKRSIRL